MTTLHRYEDALADLQAIVAERGEDFRYRGKVNVATGHNRCLYVHEDQPDCGLGKVFAERWLVPLDVLRESDKGASIHRQLKQAGHTYTEKANALLFEFQGRQDVGQSYASALQGAIDYISRSLAADDVLAYKES